MTTRNLCQVQDGANVVAPPVHRSIMRTTQGILQFCLGLPSAHEKVPGCCGEEVEDALYE